jgi:23S rRNA pseudouridine1911/1915/1917 synthase
MVDHKNGKASETAFKVLKRYQDASLIEARPKTGRTHQIRVHLYALGHPILADVLYSGPATPLIARPALHALTLRLQHPETGEWLDIQAPYPTDFQHALERLGKG